MKSAVSKVSSGSGLTLSLHPLVLINISDHFTRAKIQDQQTKPQVRGAILGIQKGRHIEIFNSYELIFNGDTLDVQYFQEKQGQFKEVFPTYDFLGWYNTSEHVGEQHIEIHKQILNFNDSPLFLQLNPYVSPSTKDLPIVIYESAIDMIDSQPHITFIEIPYKIETGEAERIAVDHVANITDSGNTDESRLTAHLSAQKNAIKMLHSRVAILLDYLVSVKKGELVGDPNTLREIASLCNRLPVMDSSDCKEDLTKEYNDVLLMTYLATMTKGTNAINELVEKFNIAYERQSGRRMKGIF